MEGKTIEFQNGTKFIGFSPLRFAEAVLRIKAEKDGKKYEVVEIVEKKEETA